MSACCIFGFHELGYGVWIHMPGMCSILVIQKSMVDDMSQYLAGFHCLVACQLYYFTPNLTSEDQLYHFQTNLHTRYLIY